MNDTQKKILIPRILSHFNNDLKGKTLGIWGLAFKPETDDIREAPALYMMEELLKQVISPQSTDDKTKKKSS